MIELKRILYVEDEPDIQAVAKLALEMVGGFTLEVCSSGQEALDKAIKFAPQLVLLDVMMPGMDGPATLAALREMPELAAVPAIFMTAKVQSSEVAHYRKLGAVEVIPKPFDPMTLSDSLRKIWERCARDEEKAAEFQAQLQAMREAYATQLPEKIRQIEEIWAGLQNQWNDETFQTLHRLVHSLTGSGITFGFTLLTDAARKLEIVIKGLIAEGHTPLSPAQRDEIVAYLKALNDASQQADRKPQ